ncbi:hypothetical protein [Vibrio crassostreae]|uniref:hypothetical protein n=1 Tax=Vibrio crassostreae TaxID=246167 RepID=UPI001049AC07|nr:hypothetical protein [Vibrio crassostreae]TCT60147.1 hypothetical protein EDB31_15415 [Vibrio crassostreae]
MAINPNESLKQLHTLYCAGSGGGKTTAIHKLSVNKVKVIPKQSRVVIFDPYGTFDSLDGRKVQVFTQCERFYPRLAALMKGNRSFVIAFRSGDKKVFEWFCRCVWAVADGQKPLHVVCEEMIRVLPSAHEANEGVREILQGGRKFGLIFHGVFQRAQEVPKSIVRGCARKWIGKPDSIADAKYWSPEMDVDAKAIASLDELEYYFKAGGIGSTVKGRLSPLRR